MNSKEFKLSKSIYFINQKAYMMHIALPFCYHHCIKDAEDTFLNPDEKYCLDQCYFSKTNLRDQYQYFMLQKATRKSLEYVEKYQQQY